MKLLNFLILLIIGFMCHAEIETPKTIPPTKKKNISFAATQIVHVPISTSTRYALPEQTPQKASLSLIDKMKSLSPITYTIGAIILGYGTLLYTFLKSSRHVKNNFFGRWKSAIPLAALYEIPEEHVVNELLDSCVQQFALPSGTELMHKIIFTYQILDSELKEVNYYLWFIKFIERAYLHYLLPNQSIVFESAIGQMERLSYLKHVLLSYAQKLVH